MEFSSTTTIDLTTYSQLEQLFKTSSEHDKTIYFLPSYEEISEYALFVFATQNNSIVGVLWNCDELLNEIFGLIAPKYRNQGLFRAMLANLRKNTLEELTFYGKPEYPLMDKCAKALGYNRSNTELLMSYETKIEPKEWKNLVLEENDTFSYYIDNNFIGSCSIFETETSINIFEVYVEAVYRNQGYGTLIINDVLWSIQNAPKKIILQVSKENAPAVRCYEKCGFVIKDAIIFYRRHT